MSTSSTPTSPTAIVAALRAAGCVFAEDEADLLISTAADDADLAAMVRRRASGVPLEQVLGWAEFAGSRIAVEPGVFVPRRRTEFLVRRAAALANPGAVVLDLCCGSAALGRAVAAALGDIELHAADVDPAAVRCARRNVPAGARVYEGDLFEPLPASLCGRIDLLLANVPYVPTGELPLLPAEARLHEPRVALDGGSDGLGVLRRVAAEAPRWLAPGGHLLFETSERQASRAAEALAAVGLVPAVLSSAEEHATVVLGRQLAPVPHGR
ncbi:release factor glutamine methyltransferase [Prauserella shujinwangii]|uniref:peptide chain release factor N(5)-glutamine methyltransferase n=1 Tax=Prauserella shujinwangii TaxID=1453103 RepID=A0A2T0M1F5_9PSEU|nr:putative protein N(5)-glutamine methyltransferase [Prauserella shujinwangii]PRX50401.1 release factor glutamine methyltransferase [Prauserella shujinwangii]